MTMVMNRLSAVAQTLVDNRLDTIDRMLLGRMPRQQRRDIIAKVETQIYELLDSRGDEEPTRENVLAVLSRLDPPEAYLPEDEVNESHEPDTNVSRPNSPRPSGRNSRLHPRVAKASGICGIISMGLIVMLPVIYFLGAILDTELLVLGGLFCTISLMFCTSLASIVLAIYCRLKSSWAIVGFVVGVVCLPLALVGGLMVVGVATALG